MFSRTERLFLERVAHGPREPTPGSVEHEFPNPSYRRKLMWGIRRKANRSLADWRLYCEAAEQDGRLLPRDPDHGPSPGFADPLVTLLGDVRHLWARRHRANLPSPTSPASKRG